MSKSLSKIKDSTLAKRLADATAEKNALLAEYTQIRDRWHAAHEQYQELVEESNRRTLEKGTDIEFILDGSDDYSMLRYRRYQSLMQEYGFNTCGGVWARTKQRVIGLNFCRQDCESNSKQIANLRMLLPYIKPITELEDGDEDIILGCKPIDILEWTLSANGSYRAYIRPDETVILSQTRFYRTTYQELGDFDTAMKYIQENHYYESYHSNDDEE